MSETPKDYYLPFAAFMGDEEPDDNDDDEWLIKGIVPAAAPTIFGGPPKVGKTWMALDVAVSVALGQDWLGNRNTLGRPGRVLVLPMEDSERSIRKRLWQILRGREVHPRDLDEILSVNSQEFFYFDDATCVEVMRATLDKWKPDLVIVDSLARSFIGDENSKADIGEMTRAWQELCRDYETTVAVIHHFGKGKEDKALIHKLRGSSDIPAMARHIVGVEGTKDPRLSKVSTTGNLEHQPEPFCFEKVQGGEEGQRSIQLVNRGNFEEAATQAMDSQILSLVASAALIQTEIEEKISGRAATIRQRLKVLTESGAISRSGKGAPYELC